MVGLSQRWETGGEPGSGDGASIAELSVLGSQASFMVFSSQDCDSDLLARWVSSLVKADTRLLSEFSASFHGRLEVAHRNTQRLSLRAPRRQRTSLSCPSASSGPSSVLGTWSGLVKMCCLHEQKDSKIIAKSVGVREKEGLKTNPGGGGESSVWLRAWSSHASAG